MSARTVRLHNSRPRYNPTLGSGSSYQIGSCQPIFGSLINSTTLQGTNTTTSPLMNNPYINSSNLDMDASGPEVQGRLFKRSRISHGELSVSQYILYCIARLHVDSTMY